MCYVGDEKGKIVKSDSNELHNEKAIKSPEEGESHKYLGVLETDEVVVNEMKNKMKKAYYRRARGVLETKLNRGNNFKSVNIWPVSFARCSAEFLAWSRLQLEEIDMRTRKLLTMSMHNWFYPKSNVDQLYLSRSEDNKELIGAQDTVETAILGFIYWGKGKAGEDWWG